MDEQAQVQGAQEHHEHDESQWMWIDNIYDWQVDEHTNGETGEKFWDVKLASGTFIEVDGQKVDVSKHHFTVDWEPAVSRGEPGTPKCMRGVHLPVDWNLTLRQFENVTPNAMNPTFVEVSRVEGVTPKQLNDGLAERAAAWRQAHRKPAHEQEQGKEAQEQSRAEKAIEAKKRSMEPAL